MQNLNFSSKNLTTLPLLEPPVYKLNISDNQISELEEIPPTLTWLNASKNEIEDVSFLPLPQLRLLNVGKNKIRRLGVGLKGCVGLKTLIANDNEIEYVDNLPELETLSKPSLIKRVS